MGSRCGRTGIGSKDEVRLGRRWAGSRLARPGRCGEHDHWSVHRTELCADRLDLLPRRLGEVGCEPGDPEFRGDRMGSGRSYGARS
jgi:hypothetical protein